MRHLLARLIRERVLDDAQRVEHLDHRNAAQTARELDGYQPRQPVVTVQQRIFGAGPLLEGHHAVGERVQVGDDLGRRHRSLRPGLDVNHSRARAERHDRRHARSLFTREHVDLEPQAPEVARDLPDVDVHPAGLFAPERGEGTRVDGDDADALHAAIPAAARRRSRTASKVMDAAHGLRDTVLRRTTVWKCSIISQ